MSLRTRRSSVLLAIAVVLASGCSLLEDDSGTETTADAAAGLDQIVASVPAARGAPFCEAMTELAAELESDPPEDLRAAIVAAYTEIEADVPAAIAADFQAVLAELRRAPAPNPATTATTVATTSADAVGSTSPIPDEGYALDDTPALRLNAYVAETCSGVRNNPGPPDTQPGADDTNSG